MNTLRTRIARLTVASVLTLGLCALAASPANATRDGIGTPGEFNGIVTMAGNPGDTVTIAADASSDALGWGATIQSAEDEASLATIGRGSGIRSGDDGAA